MPLTFLEEVRKILDQERLALLMESGRQLFRCLREA